MPVDDLDEMAARRSPTASRSSTTRERFLALTAAPFGVVVGVLLTVVSIHLNPALLLHGKPNPKHESNSLILLEGGARILLSGVVVACALARRRSLVGFALLFLGTAMGSPLFALPVLGLGGIPHLAGVQVPTRPDRTRCHTAARRQHETRPRKPPGGRARRCGRSARARPGSAPDQEGADSDRAATVEALHPTPPDTAPTTGATVVGRRWPVSALDEKSRAQQAQDLLAATYQ